MTLAKLRLPLSKRLRWRSPRVNDDPCAVFRTFVQTLAQMRAHARAPALTEKSR